MHGSAWEGGTRGCEHALCAMCMIAVHDGSAWGGPPWVRCGVHLAQKGTGTRV